MHACVSCIYRQSHCNNIRGRGTKRRHEDKIELVELTENQWTSPVTKGLFGDRVCLGKMTVDILELFVVHLYSIRCSSIET